VDAPTPRAGLGLIGVGAAACAACCAGPLLGFLAAAGIASVLGAVVFGVVGFAVVAVVTLVLWSRRRRRRCEAVAPGAVSLPEPRRKAPR
jgi:hypothetical protein